MAATVPIDNDGLNSALKNVWGQYRTWAITSRRYKNQVSGWRNIVLGLSILGAILGTLSQQLIPSLGTSSWWTRGLGIASAIALALAAYFTKEIFSPDPESKAMRARVAAEALKSTAYLMATGAPPYDTAKTTDELFEKPDKVKKAVENLPSVTITPQQKLERVLTVPMSVEDYMKQRVDDQIEYYTRSALLNEKKVSTGRWISLALGGAAVVLGVVAATHASVAGWIAVIGTITAAITARQLAGNYQFLIVTYQAAADKLQDLKDRWGVERKAEAGPAPDHRLILACEEAISAENSAWMAEWTKKSDK
jgi:uncharacterized protein YchJ